MNRLPERLKGDCGVCLPPNRCHLGSGEKERRLFHRAVINQKKISLNLNVGPNGIVKKCPPVKKRDIILNIADLHV